MRTYLCFNSVHVSIGKLATANDEGSRYHWDFHDTPLTKALHQLSHHLGDLRSIDGLWRIIERKHYHGDAKCGPTRAFVPTIGQLGRMTEAEFLQAYPTKSVKALLAVKYVMAASGERFRPSGFAA